MYIYSILSASATFNRTMQPGMGGVSLHTTAKKDVSLHDAVRIYERFESYCVELIEIIFLIDHGSIYDWYRSSRGPLLQRSVACAAEQGRKSNTRSIG